MRIESFYRMERYYAETSGEDFPGPPKGEEWCLVGVRAPLQRSEGSVTLETRSQTVPRINKRLFVASLEWLIEASRFCDYIRIKPKAATIHPATLRIDLAMPADVPAEGVTLDLIFSCRRFWEVM